MGENHLDTARCLRNLAELYEVQGNISDAVTAKQRAMEIEKKIHKEEPQDIISRNAARVK